jgi:hypothetical protein
MLVLHACEAVTSVVEDMSDIVGNSKRFILSRAIF